MMLHSLVGIFTRDLNALRREVEQYPDEASLWVTSAAAPNSGGILVRHLCGNLQHFIGAQLGATGYVRHRDAEFGAPPTPRPELYAEITRTIGSIGATLERPTPQALAAEYPIAVGGRRVRTDDFLLHLAVHLAYHLGQVDYHRRLTAGGGTVNAMSIPELASARSE